MDKTVRAVSMAEDALAAVEALRAATAKSKMRVTAKYVYDGSGNRKTFGNIRSDGNVAVIVKFSGSEYLNFGERTLSYGSSLMFAILPEGEGELWITGTDSYAQILAFGGEWL